MWCGELWGGMELHCWNGLCPWIIGVGFLCRCSDDEPFKSGEVRAVVMVGDGVVIGAGK